jgi:RimJ/RimL family protein N-acetyltransferase
MGVTLNNYSTRGYGMSTIVDQATGTIVGCCGLVHPDNQDLAEIKYALDKVHWGKGYASEVVPAMLSYGASACGLNKIIATVAEPNKASQRVLLKSGMSYSDQYKDEDGVTLVYEWSAHANEGNSS